MPRRTGRKRGAPAPALETVAEDAELQDEETQHHEAKVPGVPAQEVFVAADGAGQSKPPLPGRPRRGKTAKTAPPAGEECMMQRAWMVWLDSYRHCLHRGVKLMHEGPRGLRPSYSLKQVAGGGGKSALQPSDSLFSPMQMLQMTCMRMRS